MSFEIDRTSLLVRVPGAATLAAIERALEREGLTLGVAATDDAVGDWLARGAPGAPSSWTVGGGGPPLERSTNACNHGTNLDDSTHWLAAGVQPPPQRIKRP